MNQEIFKKLNIPEIPNDINNLRSYKDLFKLFKISQEIVDNMNNYISKIVYEEYLKTKNDWFFILNDKDYDKIKNFSYRHHATICTNDNPFIFRCLKTNTFIPFIPHKIAPTTGTGSNGEKFKYNTETNIITVLMRVTTQSTRGQWGNPVSSIQKYEINLLEKSVTEIKLSSSEERNELSNY